MLARFRAGRVPRPRSTPYRPTYFSAVPTIYARSPSCPPTSLADTSSVRFAVCGAAPVSTELLARDREPLRVPDHRGLRADRGHLRLDRQPGRRGAQARHRRASPFPASRWPSMAPDGSLVADGRARRGRHPGRQRHARLPQPARGDRRGARRRLAAHRRRRRPRRGRLPPHRRPDQRHDHPGRGEHLPQGDRDRSCTATGPSSRPPSIGAPHAVLRRGPGRLRRAATRTPRSRPRSCWSSAGRNLTKIKLPVAIHVVDHAAEERRRKDRQTALQARCNRTRRTRAFSRPRAAMPDREGATMGFTKPELPPVEPETFLRQAAHGAHEGRSPCTGSRTASAHRGWSTPSTSSKLLFFYVLGGVVVATVDRRACTRSGTSRSGGTEPIVYQKLDPLDRAPGDARRGGIVGPAGGQVQADDRRHPVLGAAGHRSGCGRGGGCRSPRGDRRTAARRRRFTSRSLASAGRRHWCCRACPAPRCPLRCPATPPGLVNPACWSRPASSCWSLLRPARQDRSSSAPVASSTCPRSSSSPSCPFVDMIVALEAADRRRLGRGRASRSSASTSPTSCRRWCSNSPVRSRSSAIKRMHYRDFPRDLRPSQRAAPARARRRHPRRDRHPAGAAVLAPTTG